MYRRPNVVLITFVLTASMTPLAAQAPSGCWAGTFGSSRGAFELTPDGGGWRGAIHRLGATVDSDPLSTIEIDGPAVTLSFPAALGPEPATFVGQHSGAELTGTIRSQGTELPVALRRTDPISPDPAAEIVGFWSGGIEQGGAIVLRLGVEVGPAPCGQVVASLDSPDQGAQDIPITAIRLDGDSLHFAVASIGATVSATVDAARSRISGSWSQGPSSIGFRLERTDSALSYNRPQEPQPPFPYESVNVTYENEVDGTVLAGTLTIPAGDGPFPAVLMLTGSGAQDRDESLMGHRPFLVIADHLTRHGIAVLRVDDRGVGGSTGDTFAATIADNVQDARAGIAFLAEQQAIDGNRIGLIGHSEGGWVAPAVVSETDDVAFLVLLAGPSVAPEEILTAQTRALMEAAGQVGVEQQVALTREVIRIIRQEPDNDRAIATILEAMAAAVDGFPPGAPMRDQWADPTFQAQLRQGLQPQVTPWFRGLLAFDPGPHLAGLDIPVLALYGGRDLQVPPMQSVPVLAEMWAGHPDATIHTFPELNHLFQNAQTGLPTEYAQIEETFAPEALEMIADWIGRRFVR